MAAVWHVADGHKNILPLLGASLAAEESSIALISPFLENGSVTQFTRSHPDRNFTSLMEDIVRGVAHLHRLGIVHGYLQGSSVLVDNHGVARIAGFTLAREVEASINTTSSLGFGNWRWAAPERLDPQRYNMRAGDAIAPAADIYSLGMTLYEIISGNIPYADMKDQYKAGVAALDGIRPSRPVGTDAVQRGLTDRLWDFIQRCWAERPGDRPTYTDLLSYIGEDLSERSVTDEGRVPSAVPQIPSIEIQSLYSWGGLSKE